MRFNDSELFYAFLQENGFKPNNCGGILELNSSVSNSSSQYMSEYPQFLLSEHVDYSELSQQPIAGAKGYLTIGDGIVVPKSLAADDYFNAKKPYVPYKIHGYRYPQIEEFDTAIVPMRTFDEGEIGQAIISVDNPLYHYFIGFIADRDDWNLDDKKLFLEELLTYINSKHSEEHELVHDRFASQSKELYLIKKKGIHL